VTLQLGIKFISPFKNENFTVILLMNCCKNTPYQPGFINPLAPKFINPLLPKFINH